MIDIKNKLDCCGCFGCVSACPVKCIEMKKDSEGFAYPLIDGGRCIGCDMCESVCPVINCSQDLSEKVPQAFMAWSLDEEIRRQSSSGGMFTMIAEYILDNGGIVFGAAFEDMQLRHIAVEDKASLARLRGSKYLQSEIGNAYSQVKKELEYGRQVLFSGTPCQVEGLNVFLQKKYDNLLLVDFICHGVPSPDVFDEYKKELEEKYGSAINEFQFRDKTFGWLNYTYKVAFENGESKKGKDVKDVYSKAFLSDLCLRPSCYSCPFKKLNRVSDITLADFWGFDKLYPNLHDDKGVSLVFVHTDRANELLKTLDGRIFINPADVQQALLHNPSMTKSVSIPKKRDVFMETYKKYGIKYALKECTKQPFYKTVRRKISDIVYLMIKRIRKTE